LKKKPETEFIDRLNELLARQATLLKRPNQICPSRNGIYQRYKYPVLTAEHVPVDWRYDLKPATNPLLIRTAGDKRRVQLRSAQIQR
jgi:4-O-beta-D-mannosyl-D-glucose phosphorylase